MTIIYFLREKIRYKITFTRTLVCSTWPCFPSIFFIEKTASYPDVSFSLDAGKRRREGENGRDVIRLSFPRSLALCEQLYTGVSRSPLREKKASELEGGGSREVVSCQIYLFCLRRFSKTRELWSSKGAFTIAFFAAVNHNYDYTAANRLRQRNT